MEYADGPYAVSGKYWPLHRHLKSQTHERLVLRFEEIEQILGDLLPASARSPDHGRQWWANKRNGGQAQSRAWLDAGYRVQAVDIEREHVTFVQPDGLRHTARNFVIAEVRRVLTGEDGFVAEPTEREERLKHWVRIFSLENDLPREHKFVRAFETVLAEALGLDDETA